MMKKKTFIVSIIAFFLGVSSSHAGTFMVGAKAWYSAWDSAFAKSIGQVVHDDLESGSPPVSNTVTINTGTGYLAGPVVGFQTDDRKWSVSAAAMLFSSFNQDTKIQTSSQSFVLDMELTRKDLDFSAGYSISEHLKLFAGYKYMYTRADLKLKSVTTVTDLGWVQTMNNIGSVGVGTAFALSDKFLLSGQFGLLFVETKMEEKDGTTHKVDNSGGYTAEAALSYLLAQSVIIQAGVKYQTFVLKIKDWNTSERDNFFGFTASAIYMF